VERVSDHVAMIDRGRIVLCGPLDDVRLSYRRVTLRFDEPRSQPPALVGSLTCEGGGHEWTVVCRGTVEELAGAASGIGARVVEEHVPTLDEIFVARVGSRKTEPVEG
jgi:ABC-2 type transport system ATP-binding protein